MLSVIRKFEKTRQGLGFSGVHHIIDENSRKET
jgi:hypothetical protein